MVECSVKKLTLRILIVATCIQLASLFSLFIYWHLLREKLTEDIQQQQQLCIRLDRLITFSGDEDACPEGSMMNMKNDTKTCCGKSDLILDKLVAKALSEKYNSDSNPELPSLDLKLDQCNVSRIKSPMIKVVGLSLDKNQVEEGNSSRIFWNSSIQMYDTPDLTYIPNEGTIWVGKTGYYFIQSQIKAQVFNADDKDDVFDGIFTHNVHLIAVDKNTSSTILGETKSKCEIASKESEFTSVIGGVYKLENGDRLNVATSDPKRLVQGDNCIVFSMYSL